MLPPDLRKLLAIILHSVQLQGAQQNDALRRNLTDQEYADWFLSEKIQNGSVNPAYAINDFVVFRVAFEWPRGASGWVLDASDLITCDFALDDVQATDLVDMAREGLNDGYVPASWFAKVAAAWYVAKERRMPESLFEYLQEALFLPYVPRQGRKKTDGRDRDIVIRNLVEGLLARNLGQPAALTHARAVTVDALGRKGIGMTEDAVRKICDRSSRTDREIRLWSVLTKARALERKA